MPHDKNGQLLSVGDVVDIPCVIKEIHDTEGYCNVNLETCEPMFPEQYKSVIVVNAKQVVRKNILV